MPALEHLGPVELGTAMAAFRDVLAAHRESINRSNVYPVPDGDTGTNMASTVEAVCAEVAGSGSGADLAAVCDAMARGSLMGARGNSGVILSQILRALSDAALTAGGLGAQDVASALAAAADAAYAAVLHPVEGTILSVARGAALGAAGRGHGGGLVDVLEAARLGAAEALARTPEQLPVLAEAGVVDAGGRGFVLMLDALLTVADGRALPAAPPDGAPGVASPFGDGGPAEGPDANRYEVMFLLDAPEAAIERFKAAWDALGESIVVVGGGRLWNCHVHTDDIGAAIEAGLEAGRPHRIRVTDLREQNDEQAWVRAVPVDRARTRCAAVAVGAGAGVERILRSLGAAEVVVGGQSMNPSTAELLEAVEAAPSDEVVLLPDNKNVVAVAGQVDAHTDKVVRVVPTRSVTEGFAALVAFDPDASAHSNVEAMTAAAAAVLGGQVTRAVRPSRCSAGTIAEGDWLGIDGQDEIVAVETALYDAAVGLLRALVGEHHEVVTIVEGEGSGGAVTRELVSWLAEHRPGTQADVHHGGQPLYPYLFGVE